ncbi:MAG: MFS transporter, partial [Gammaproteobacteria bacterium]|nr:MFS transporter [Gammaproteobacteria bacterium]
MATKKQKVAFSSLRKPDFRSYTVGGTLWMMGDNIEHVISYWVIFATFQSPLLGGYAVLSHWAPSLLFGVHAGALADRFDNRKITIFSMFLFILTSTSWAVLFLTDSIQVWHAVTLLTIHGLAGSLYQPANQLLVHDIVGDDELQSAVPISSTSRQLRIFLGQVEGGFLLLV